MILNKTKNYRGVKYYQNQAVDIVDSTAQRWINRDIARYAYMDDNDLVSNFKCHSLEKHARVTIIIPVAGALEYLKKCLNSLVRYTQNYELVIVDNGSDKETKKYLSGLNVKLQTNDKNMGFSYACNQGIKLATSDYICMLNSDTVLTPNWLSKLLKGFDRPNAGIVGPSTCYCRGKQCIWELAGKRTGMTQEEMNAVDVGKGIIETDIYGFCYLIKKEVIDKIGVFDYKKYPIGSAEEKDFSWRAGKAGYKSYWVQNSYVHHYGNKTFIDIGVDPGEQRRKNDIAFNKRKSDRNIYVENTVKIDTEPIPILMIVLDRLEYTKKAIKAIFENTIYPFKLFIFNNGSDSETTEYLESLDDSRIEMFHSEANIGLIPPMNMFFDRFKSSKYVGKVDNDTVVSKGWLGKLKDVMDVYPLFTLQANHYLAMPFGIESNDDFYKHLYSVDFNGDKIYFYKNSGGTGQLIRRSVIDRPMPGHSVSSGGLSGWCSMQVEKYRQYPSAFHSGVWIDRLDQIATNRYKDVSDYPDYDKMIKKMRPWGLGHSNIDVSKFAKIKKDIELWFTQI